ncbi:CAMK family protein kinase [Histomonas meleagridis]|uniref:CAMK family protein kinase n=1 Tax=Histomonas meleagridis TaxID=135588 RepID=UPI00355AC7A0|nr:CAMK family protein kinase [Histomonas meleagridis]KAH0797969.1 CAMK family protein kinase [Histomonas meleagridis]
MNLWRPIEQADPLFSELYGLVRTLSFEEFQSQYHYVKIIHQSRNSTVRLATHIETGQSVIMKTIYKSKLTNPKQVCALAREIKILRFFGENRHITELYDALDVIDGIYLILEYAEGGDLYSYISTHKHLQEYEIKRFFYSIVKTVSFMHINGYVHRDLKLENILLDENGRVMLADFGCSREFKEGEFTSSVCGTVQYEPPEILLCKSYDATKVDSWALGIILYALFFNKLPYNGNSVCEALGQIVREEIVIPNGISEDARKILHGLLCNDPEKRLRVVDLPNHPWLRRVHLMQKNSQKKDRIHLAALKTMQESNTEGMDENKLVSYRIMKRKYQVGKMLNMNPVEHDMGRIPTPEARARECRSKLILRPMSANIAQKKLLASLVPPSKFI